MVDKIFPGHDRQDSTDCLEGDKGGDGDGLHAHEYVGNEICAEHRGELHSDARNAASVRQVTPQLHVPCHLRIR